MMPSQIDIAAIDEIIAEAFAMADQLEGCFAKSREMSDVNRLSEASVGTSIPVNNSFARLLPEALQIWQTSLGAFDPFIGTVDWKDGAPVELIHLSPNQTMARKLKPCALDLSGMANGFIADELARFLESSLAEFGGVIDAGGDLLFFRATERVAEIRLGPGFHQVRQLSMAQNALATSALPASPNTSPRAGLRPSYRVSVVADTCATAHALTKVGWLASATAAQACAQKCQAQILVFDDAGEIVEQYPSPRSHEQLL